MKPKPQVSIKVESHTKELNAALKRMQSAVVKVGIAQGSRGDSRKDGGPPNSLLGWVHERGSPAANIPARPFLRPGIEDAKDEIKDGLKAAMRAALANDVDGMNAELEKTGMIAVSSVKSKMREGPFEPLKPDTIRSRNRSRGTKGKRENETQGRNIKPLINTGALRDAIDFYVEGK